MTIPTPLSIFLHGFATWAKEHGYSHNTIKNYTSDATAFVTWATAWIKNNPKIPALLPVSLFTPHVIARYRSWLTHPKNTNNQEPKSKTTLERQVAGLKVVCQYAATQGIIKADTLDELIMILDRKTKPASTKPTLNPTSLTNKFLTSLEKQKRSPSTIKNYTTDLTCFFTWATTYNHTTELGELLHPYTLQAYKHHLHSHHLSPATVRRRFSSLSTFAIWAKSQNLLTRFQPSAPTLGSGNHKPTSGLGQKIVNGLKRKVQQTQASVTTLRFANPKLYRAHTTLTKAYQNYTRLSFTRYLHWAILIIVASLLGFGLYTQIFTNASPQLAYPSTPTRPKRYLSFQGRLTDSSGNPITSATNITFRLWDLEEDGTEGTCTGDAGENCLWKSGASPCSITPDQNGIFNTILGSTCGAEIASEVFSENSEVWLEITTASETMTPRQRIATVPYALNAETLQGYPVGVGGTATANTVLVMNSDGNIGIGETATLISNSSFGIESAGIMLSVLDGTGEDITINPDDSGILNLNFEGASAGTGGGFINATNANLSGGALYYGEVASNASGYDFVQFKSGSTAVEVFAVDYAGNTQLAGNLTVGGTGPHWFLTGNVGIGSTSPSAKLDVVGTAWLRGASDQNGLYVSSTGYVGAGTTNPTYKLHVVGNGYFSTNLNIGGSAGVVGNLSVGGTASLATARLLGALQDVNGSAGGNGQILKSTGTGTTWADITSIGVGGSGTTNYLAKWTPDGNRLGNALIFDDGLNIGIGTTAATAPSLYISAGGNVGIGTTNPSTKLEINGNLFMSGGDIKTDRWISRDDNTFLGVGVGGSGLMSGAISNTAMGYQTLFDLTTGDGLVAIGYQALTNNTSSSYNTAVGYSSLYTTVSSSSSNTAIGAYSLYSATSADSNVAIGYEALYTNSGADDNVAIGRAAMRNNNLNQSNVAVGNYSLDAISGNDSNVNIALGYNALTNLTTNSPYNIGIGFNAGGNLTSGANNNIMIGTGTSAPNSGSDYQLNIGSSIFGNMVNDYIGIGSTSTNAHLSIGIGNTAAIGLKISGITSQVSNYFEINSGNTDGGDLLVFDENAMLGLGTTSPAYKLHVVGDGYLSTNLNIGGSAGVVGNLSVGGTASLTTARLLGTLQDVNGSAGTNGQILKSTGTGTTWADITSIGVGGSGTTNYLAKWTPDGNRLGNALIFDDGTNVGIGTTAATAPSLYISAGGNVGIGTTGPLALTHISSTAAQDLFRIDDNGFGDTSPFVINQSGNVGIGTSSPTRELDIRANSGGIKLALSPEPSLYYLDIFQVIPGGSVDYHFQVKDVAGGTTTMMYYDSSTGFLGIGTTAPANKLTVSGNANITGNLGIGTTNPTYKLHVVGDGYVSESLSVGGSASITSSLSVGTTATIPTLNLTGALLDGNGSAGSNTQILSSTGTATDWVDISTIGVGGSGTTNYLAKWTPDGNHLGNALIFDDGTNVGIGTTAATAPSLYISAGGNVGVGTTNPSAKLQIDGQIYIRGISDTSQLIVRANSAQSTTSPLILLESSTGTDLMAIHSNNATNVFVGIGTGQSVAPSGSHGKNNVALGSYSINKGNSDNNTAVGAYSLYNQSSVTGAVAIGYQSLYSGGGNGTYGVAIGTNALYSDTSGDYNTAIGGYTLYNSNANNNTALGYKTGYYNYSGSGNVFLGYQAGIGATNNANQTGNIFIGYQAGDNIDDGDYNIVIGYDQDIVNEDATYQLNIGGSIYGDLSKDYIGIGTTSSSAHLHIGIGNTAATGLRITGIGSQVTNYLEINNNTGSNGNLLVFNENANLGLGTTSPTYKLHVVGNGYVSTNLNIGGSAGVAGNLSVGGTASLATARLLGALQDVNGSAGTNGQILKSTGAGTTWADITSIGVGGSGTTNYLAKWTPDGNRLGNALIYDSGLNVGIGTTAATAPSLYISAGGNVGVGTTGPSEKLHIKDTGSINLFLEADSDNSNEADHPSLTFSQDGGSATARIGYYNSTNSLQLINNLGGAYMLIDESGGLSFVPVSGQSTVASTTAGSTAPSFKITNYDNEAAVKFVSFVDENSNEDFWMKTDGAGGTNVTTYFRGSVGIGTTSPGARLEVFGGNIRITSTDDMPSIQFYEGVNPRWTVGNDSAPNNYFAISMGGDLTSEKLVIDTSGNIGIGTTNPGYQLHVVGDGYLSTNLNIGGSAGVTGNLSVGGTASLTTTRLLGALQDVNGSAGTNGQILKSTGTGTTWADITSIGVGGSGTTNYLAKWTPDGNRLGNALIYDDGTNVGIGTTAATAPSLYVSAGGNVGIGTTNPGVKLEVSDTTLYNSFYTIANIISNHGSIDFMDDGRVGIERTTLRIKNNAVQDKYPIFQSNIDGESYARFGFTTSGKMWWGSGASTYDTNLYRNAANVLQTDDGLNIAGNVGIGITSPGYKLHVVGDLYASTSVSSPYFVDSNDSTYYLDPASTEDTKSSATFTNTGKITFNATYDTGDARWEYAHNTGSKSAIRILATDTGLAFDSTAQGTGGSAVSWGNDLFLRYDGNLGVGTTAPGYDLEVVGTGYFSTTLGVGTTLSTNTLSITGTLKDTSGDVGTNGQILSSTATGTNWVNITGGTSYWSRSGTNLSVSTAGDDVYLQSNELLGVGYNPAGISNAVAAFSGNVGIGNSNPSAQLEITGNLALSNGADRTISIETGDNSEGDDLTLKAGDAGSGIGGINGGDIILSGGSQTNNGAFGDIILNSNTNNWGNVGIGTSAPNYKLEVNGTVGVGATATFNQQIMIPNMSTGGTYAMRRSTGGLLTYVASSIRYKTNVKDLSFNTDTFLTLNPKTFTWKSDGSDDSGFIAEEVATIMPDLVVYENGVPNGVDYHGISIRMFDVLKQHEQTLDSLVSEKLDSSGALAIRQTDDSSFQVYNTETNAPITTSTGFGKAIIANLTTGITTASHLVSNSLSAITAGIKDLVAENITLSSKLTSPLVETDNLTTNSLLSKEATLTHLSADTISTDNLETNALLSREATIENLTVNNLIAQTIQTASVSADTATFTNLSALTTLESDDVRANTASFSSLTTDELTTPKGTLTSRLAALRDELTTLVASTSGTQPDPVDSNSTLDALAAGWSTNSAVATISGSLSLTNDMIIQGKLAVLGQSNFTTVFASSQLGVGNLTFSENTISTTATTLAIQPSGVGQIALLGNTLLVSDDGSIIINGNLTVNGMLASQNLSIDQEATISGSLFASLVVPEKLEFTNSAGELSASIDSSGSAFFTKVNIATGSATPLIAESGFAQIASTSAQILSNATAGTVTLPAGKNEITIYTSQLNSDSLVYLTPAGSTQNHVLYLKTKFASPTPTECNPSSPTPTNCSFFTAGLDEALTTDLAFNYWIVN